MLEAYLSLVLATSLLLGAPGSAPVANDVNGNTAMPSFRDGFILNLLNAKAYAAFLALFTGFLLPGHEAWIAYAVTAATIFVVAFVIR